MLGTASGKGTVIRIYNTQTLDLVKEFRRGHDYASIESIAFDNKDKWLACSSDSGTVHIFSLSTNN